MKIAQKGVCLALDHKLDASGQDSSNGFYRTLSFHRRKGRRETICKGMRMKKGLSPLW